MKAEMTRGDVLWNESPKPGAARPTHCGFQHSENSSSTHAKGVIFEPFFNFSSEVTLENERKGKITKMLLLDL